MYIYIYIYIYTPKLKKYSAKRFIDWKMHLL